MLIVLIIVSSAPVICWTTRVWDYLLRLRLWTPLLWLRHKYSLRRQSREKWHSTTRVSTLQSYSHTQTVFWLWQIISATQIFFKKTQSNFLTQHSATSWLKIPPSCVSAVMMMVILLDWFSSCWKVLESPWWECLGCLAMLLQLLFYGNNKYCLQAVRLDIGKIKITITEQIVATKYRMRCQKRKCTKILHRLRFYGKI